MGSLRIMALPEPIALLQSKSLKDRPDLICDDIEFNTPKGDCKGKAEVLAKLKEVAANPHDEMSWSPFTSNDKSGKWYTRSTTVRKMMMSITIHQDVFLDGTGRVAKIQIHR